METNLQINQNLSSKIEVQLQKYPIILQVLRFGAIGVINTALDFIVLNVVSKTFGISSGLQLGSINVIGFSLAVIQSYFWNHYWAFNAGQIVSLWKNFIRLVLVGALGALAVLIVLLGSNASAPASFYLIILAIFVIAEIVLWYGFELNKNAPPKQAASEFLAFLFVSIIGLAINSVLIGLISSHLQLVASADLNKNIAKILATLVSLIWNFIGYKIFVFKK